jgi:hypothetical protein
MLALVLLNVQTFALLLAALLGELGDFIVIRQSDLAKQT